MGRLWQGSPVRKRQILEKSWAWFCTGCSRIFVGSRALGKKGKALFLCNLFIPLKKRSEYAANINFVKGSSSSCDQRPMKKRCAGTPNNINLEIDLN